MFVRHKLNLSWGRVLASLSIASLGAGCADHAAATWDVESLSLPSERAPFRAGTSTLDVPAEGGLELLAQIWFPAFDQGDVAYLYDDMFASGVLAGATPDCSSPRPVLLFSHGNGSARYASWFLTEALAARGFVVAAPDHQGNTMFDLGDVHFTELLTRRPADMIATWEALVAASDDPAHALHGCIDPSLGFAVGGHSFGGYTALGLAGADPVVEEALEHCEAQGGTICDALMDWMSLWLEEHPSELGPVISDPRVTAALVHAPAGYDFLVGALGGVEVPTLVLAGKADDLTPWASHVAPLYAELGSSSRALGGVEAAGHFSFSNACDLLPVYEDCSAPFLPLEEVHGLAWSTSYAWLAHALGREDALDWIDTEDERLDWSSAQE